MQCGQLNKRIEIQSPTSISDGMGGFSVVYVTNCTVFAAIWPTSAAEMVQSMQTDMVITHRIRIWYRTGILPSWRIRFGTRYFNIVSIINASERNEVLDLICKEST